jgi:peptidoglycan/xylan/chitin deacetylase (PgdA/CDA1 family)
MKRLVALFVAVLMFVFGALPALQPIKATAAAPNLVPNPSAESGTTTPTSWLTGSWGDNNATYSWENDGHTGSRSLKVQMTTYTDGDAKWYFTPVAVTAGSTYSLSEWYKASVPTQVFVQFDNGIDYSYLELGTKAAAANWTQQTGSFTVPAGFTHATIFHVISTIGTLQTDDYSLSKATTMNVQVTSPAAGATVNGTAVPLKATASSDGTVAGVQFKVDGVNIGSEDTTAPYELAWDSTTVTNGAHNITATVRDTDATTLVSTAVPITVTNTAAPGANIVPNPGAETVGANTQPDQWQQGGWGNNAAVFTHTKSTNVHSGKRALKVQLTSYTDGDAKWYFTPQAIEGGKLYNFSNWYKSNTTSYVVADIAMNDGSHSYITLGTLVKSANAWAKFEQQFSAPEGAATVTVFHLIRSVGQVTTDDYSLKSYNPTGFNRPLVSITFDDAWASVHNNAFPLLEQYNMDSTQYLLSGKTADPLYMTGAMMTAMKNAGHEVASHTIDHADLATLTSAQVQQQLQTSKSSLKQLTGVTPVNFASPYGSVNQNVLTQIKKYYGSHRGVIPGYNSKNYFNPYNIKVQNITNATTLTQVQAWIAKAQATNTWLVLVYHQVEANPTVPEEAQYNTTPAQLESHLQAIQASGLTVSTVSQALAELKAQL